MKIRFCLMEFSCQGCFDIYNRDYTLISTRALINIDAICVVNYVNG